MSSDAFWIGVATFVATLAGPIIAVIVTRINDDRRSDRARKLDIFRTLMRTRRLAIHAEHVGALNLVEVEFIGHAQVIASWKAYLQNLGERLPPAEEKDRFEGAIKRRDALLTKLIHEISRVLNLKIEQLDILEGNYVPQGWHDDEIEQRLARKSLLDLLQGRAPILVQPFQPPKSSGPYPPAPEAKGASRPSAG